MQPDTAYEEQHDDYHGVPQHPTTLRDAHSYSSRLLTHPSDCDYRGALGQAA